MEVSNNMHIEPIPRRGISIKMKSIPSDYRYGKGRGKHRRHMIYEAIDRDTSKVKAVLKMEKVLSS